MYAPFDQSWTSNVFVKHVKILQFVPNHTNQLIHFLSTLLSEGERLNFKWASIYLKKTTYAIYNPRNTLI